MNEFYLDVKCLQCGQVFKNNRYVESLQVDNSNKGIKIRGECPFCRNWVKWIPYKESEYVKKILRYFYYGDLKAQEELRKTAIYNCIKKEIE